MLRGMPFSNPRPSARSDNFSRPDSTPLQARQAGTRATPNPSRPSVHSVRRSSSSNRLRVRVDHSHRIFGSPSGSQTRPRPIPRSPRQPRENHQSRSARPIATAQLDLLSSALGIPASTAASPASSRSPRTSLSDHLRPSDRTLACTEMSFFNPLQTNYLSAKLQVDFDESTVDMLGGPNTGTSYSLPGHVVIALPCLPHALDGRIREIRMLDVVLEGKSEFFDDEGRYTPMRLHTSTIHLASSASPWLVPARDPSRPKSSHIHMAIPFDLRLPGWLPPSHRTGKTNTAHGVRVTATIGWLNASALESSFSPRKALWANTSMFPFATAESLSKFTEFTVRRHRFPSTFDRTPITPRERQYSLRSDSNSASPIECIVTVPEWVDTHGDERSLRVTLRMKARDMAKQMTVVESGETPLPPSAPADVQSTQDAATQTEAPAPDPALPSPVPMEKVPSVTDTPPRTHLIEIGMEVEEVARYSSTGLPSFVCAFPLPAEQPTGLSLEHALISPRSVSSNPLENQYLNTTPYSANVTRQCLLAEDGNQRNFFFADDGLSLCEIWRKVNIVLPMPDQSGSDEYRNGGRPQAEMDGAFLRIRHNLKTRIVCRTPGSTADTVVILSTPIRFGTSPHTTPSPCSKPLPAYIQLFHENGDLRECDPLPIYTKHPADSVAPSSPVPDYKTLFPSACTTCTPDHEAQPPIRSPSPAGSSTSASSDTMDIDPPHESPNTSWIPSIPGGPVCKIPAPRQTEGSIA